MDTFEIFNALEKFINQRSRLDHRDYGFDANGRAAYRSDARQVMKDGNRARKALADARALQPARLAVLLDSFRAFSGRLEWIPGKSIDGTCKACAGGFKSELGPIDHYANCETRGHLEYCTGQFFPTEFRKAAAAVLETYCAAWRAAQNAENPQTFTYSTMDDVIAANAAIGNHWFEPSSMRFFKTKIESRLIAGHRFVTSEKGPDGVRRYSVRDAKPDGTIDTIGEFQAHATKRKAMAAVLSNPTQEVV